MQWLIGDPKFVVVVEWKQTRRIEMIFRNENHEKH
jgi:hypothetical protein